MFGFVSHLVAEELRLLVKPDFVVRLQGRQELFIVEQRLHSRMYGEIFESCWRILVLQITDGIDQLRVKVMPDARVGRRRGCRS